MSDIANAMLAQAQHAALDGDQTTIASVAHRFTVVGTAVAGQFDQTPFYNLLADVALGASYILSTAIPAESEWSTAALWRYTADVPAPLVNIHITDFNNTSNLSGGRIQVQRKTPEGSGQLKNIALGRYRTSDQFQLGIMSIPINGEPLDGYTTVRLIFPGSATPNSYGVTFTFGDTLDRRASVPSAQARIITGARAR